MRVAPWAIAFAGLLHFAAPGSLAAQDDSYVPPADELAEARVIIEAMFPSDRREQILLDMATTTAKQAIAGYMTGPAFDEPGIKAIIDSFIADLPSTFAPLFAKHLPKIFEATAIAYTREFTLEELRDIAAFARTPSGQRYFISLQKFPSDPAVAAANQAMFADVAVLKKDKSGAVRKQVEEYLMANPDVLERLSKAGVGADQ